MNTGETSKPDGRKQAELASLLERVEKAEGPNLDLSIDIARALHWQGSELTACAWDNPEHAFTAAGIKGAMRIVSDKGCAEIHFTASLDAAVALVEKMLPGWEWNVGVEYTPHHRGSEAALVSDDYASDGSSGHAISGWAQTPALALLHAMLRALIACAPPAETHSGSSTNRPQSASSGEDK